MTLAPGDYRAVEDQAVATLLADQAPGGLRDPAGPVAATVMAADEELASRFGQAEFPAVMVRVTGKTETPQEPARSVLKSFELRLIVLHRALDRGEAEEKTREVAARLEALLRGETRSDRQFQGLPDLIDGGEGTLAVALNATEFIVTRAAPDQCLGRAEVKARIMVPCVFGYE
jgi:hypothetical protein